MRIQDKVMKEIEKVAEKHNLEFVISPSFSNCGTVQIMDGFKTILGFSYDFQDSWRNCSLQFYPGNKPIVRTCGFTDNNCIGHYYIKYEELDVKIPQMINFINNHLAKHKEAV